MVGLIILVSVVSVAYIVCKTAKLKKTKYILAPIISILYGVMLFFVGMSMEPVLFYILAVAPLIIGVIQLVKQNHIKKN